MSKVIPVWRATGNGWRSPGQMPSGHNAFGVNLADGWQSMHVPKAAMTSLTDTFTTVPFGIVLKTLPSSVMRKVSGSSSPVALFVPSPAGDLYPNVSAISNSSAPGRNTFSKLKQRHRFMPANTCGLCKRRLGTSVKLDTDPQFMCSNNSVLACTACQDLSPYDSVLGQPGCSFLHSSSHDSPVRFTRATRRRCSNVTKWRLCGPFHAA
mmetsp:Transcript_58152/g.177201  ORF Transcript_58152/g.177201 Transcript_58152/m.177201 type:complete len:209 (+) Transcript_58152:989-1615(+)